MTGCNPFLDLLGIQYPVLQAPMAGVSTPQLAAAVSNAGGLGALGLGASSPDQAGAAIAATRALTERPFNVNLFCHRPAQADTRRETDWLTYLQPWFDEFGVPPPPDLHAPYGSFNDDDAFFALLLQLRPAVASFHFGLPSNDKVAALRQAGIVTLACATSPDEAAQCAAVGVDAIIAQGIEAGGHRGVFEPDAPDAGLDTLSLVRQIRTATPLPIIAAGGIMDGQGIARALAAGAAAVQLGTAFILSPESAAGSAYRAAVSQAGPQATRMTRVISGRPARGLLNRMHTQIDQPQAPPLPDYPIAYAAGKALATAAATQGCHDFDAQWAGQGVAAARALPAGELLRRLVLEWQAASRTD